MYVHQPDWYISVESRRETMEQTVTAHDLDLSGWDYKKALNLVRNSHPTLLEWLRSPIVYIEVPEPVQILRDFAIRYFDPAVGMHHYLGWAIRIYRRYLQGDRLPMKRYLYVLRPLLAAHWIHLHGEAPPMALTDLVEGVPMAPATRDAIRSLVSRKRSGEELGLAHRDQVLDAFIMQEERYLRPLAAKPPQSGMVDYEPLNEAFRRVVGAAT